MLKVRCLFVLMTVAILGTASDCATPEREMTGRVTPLTENPHYLAWDGTPVFGLGPSPLRGWYFISRPEEVDLEQNLDRLAQVIEAIDSPYICGFVRSIPYDPLGGVEGVLQPWLKLADGRYDLGQFSPDWENRLRSYLAMALERRIIVSLEVWDDWSLTRGVGGAHNPGPHAVWNAHPFNPQNNINYDEDVLPISTHRCNPPFYRTLPSLEDNRPVFELQKHYVDHLMNIASDYPNVMINISNESRATLEWSRFWAGYIRPRVAAHTMIGDMPSTNRHDGGGECEDIFSPLTLSTDPLYDYVDMGQSISRHSFGSPQEQALMGSHRIREYRRAMADAGTERPLVISKDYTNDANGGDMVLWSRFIGGAATARFHRPYSGDAETTEAVVQFQHEAAERLGHFVAQLPFWRMQPAPELITELPDGAGANVLAEADSHCVIQLIGGAAGQTLNLDIPAGIWVIRWVDPATGHDLARSESAAGQTGLQLDIPEGPEHRVVHLEKK